MGIIKQNKPNTGKGVNLFFFFFLPVFCLPCRLARAAEKIQKKSTECCFKFQSKLMRMSPFNISFLKNFMAPSYGWGSTASRLEPLRGGSLLFTTKFPEIPTMHLKKFGPGAQEMLSDKKIVN